MASNVPPKKTLAILGSGGHIATGALIYMFGGIDLKLLAKLEERGIDSYAEAVQELKKTNEELYFYTPRHRVTVCDQPSGADGVLLVVTPPSQASENLFTNSTVGHLKDSASYFARKKAIILIKSIADHERQESVHELVQKVGTALQDLGIEVGSTPIVPSDLQGENFIEISPKTPWHTKPTLVAGLDEILSQQHARHMMTNSLPIPEQTAKFHKNLRRQIFPEHTRERVQALQIFQGPAGGAVFEGLLK